MCELCESPLLKMDAYNIDLMIQRKPFVVDGWILNAFHEIDRSMTVRMGFPINYCPMCGRKLDEE